MEWGFAFADSGSGCGFYTDLDPKLFSVGNRGPGWDDLLAVTNSSPDRRNQISFPGNFARKEMVLELDGQR